MSAVERSIEQGSHRGGVAKQRAPVVQWTIGGQDGRGSFMATHDELTQSFGRGGRQFPHAEVVNDQERDDAERCEEFFACTDQRGDVRLIPQRRRFAMVYAVALFDRRRANRLRKATFPAPGGPSAKYLRHVWRRHVVGKQNSH